MFVMSIEEIRALTNMIILITKKKELFKEVKNPVAVIPGGLTDQLQPSDVFINKPFTIFTRKSGTNG